jgi:hypothetical protein
MLLNESESVTCRGGFIMIEALATAIVSLEQLPLNSAAHKQYGGHESPSRGGTCAHRLIDAGTSEMSDPA